MADEIVNLYYDYKSPFTYLAMQPMYDLEKAYRIALRCIPLELNIKGAFGGTLDQRDERNCRTVRYLHPDARRYATARGLVLRGPQKIFDSRLSLMSGMWADRHGKFRPYSDRVFERFFKRELDIEDGSALAKVMAEVGLDAAGFAKYVLGDGPRELQAAAEEAEREGVFGVPTMIVAGEPFWGNDRVEWIAKKLDAMSLRRSG